VKAFANEISEIKKFKAKNDFEFDNLLDSWQGLKLYFGRGYRVRYVISDEIRNDIEKDIMIDGLLFKPKLILSEDEFRIEGYLMKNCMAKQFLHGAIYLQERYQCTSYVEFYFV
jgi:hypothetical protein